MAFAQANMAMTIAGSSVATTSLSIDIPSSLCERTSGGCRRLVFSALYFGDCFCCYKLVSAPVRVVVNALPNIQTGLADAFDSRGACTYAGLPPLDAIDFVWL
eukprot:6484353-Amphidinium_carterae.1